MPDPTYRQIAQEAADKLQRELEINDVGGLLLLESFTAIYATELECAAAIERDGLLIKDRFGQAKDHPLLRSLRDARSQKLMVMKALGLDLIETNSPGPGRPPRGY